MHLFQPGDHPPPEGYLWPHAGTHRYPYCEVSRVDFEKLSDDRLGEPSANIQSRVEAARVRQSERFTDSPLACNADMRPAEVRDFCQLDETSNSLMRTAMNQMQISARAYRRVLKLSRTIFDLAGEQKIAPTHQVEALQYRPRENIL